MKVYMFVENVFIMICCIVIGVFVFACPVDSSSTYERLNHFLLENKFNGSILVAKNGKVVFHSAYGFADVNRTVPLTTKSSFNLASVSKQFTAAAIMILYEHKKLKLDDQVADYLPRLSYAKGITIRHLLNHTSGLPDIYAILKSQWDHSKVAGNEVLLKLFSDQKPALLFEPGERMQYSNTGYIILGSVIEAVSGQSYFDFMDQNIFKPLDMKDSYTYYLTMKNYPRPERVWGLSRQNGKTVLNDLIYCDGMRGDGTVHSSTEDLFKWDRALYNEKLLKSETLQMMFTPGKLNNGQNIPYGFGWGISAAGKTVSHSGSWVGFRCLIVRCLDRQDLIIILMNNVSPNAGNIAEKIREIYKLR